MMTATRKVKILLVDDSKFLRISTERALARVGYDVITAVDGEEAIALARQSKPDVMLLDMLLPKVPGLEVLKAVKKDPETADIAVIVLTGLSNRNANRLEQDGACAFLEKSELGLERGCEALLVAVADIVRKLNLPVAAHAAGAE